MNYLEFSVVCEARASYHLMKWLCKILAVVTVEQAVHPPIIAHQIEYSIGLS